MPRCARSKNARERDPAQHHPLLGVSRRSQNLVGFLAPGAVQAFYRQGRSTRALSDEPVLLFDDGARGGVAIQAAKDIARHPAIGALRTIFVNHVKKREFDSGCGLACHVLGFLLLLNGGPAIDGDGGIMREHVRQMQKRSGALGTGADVSFRQDQTFWRFDAANLPRSLTTS